MPAAPGFIRRRQQDLPGFWRLLLRTCRALRPSGTLGLGPCRTSVLSSPNWTASTPTTNTNFGAQSHGPPARCLRFAGWGLQSPPRKTRFRRLANLTGRDWLPLGSRRKVSGHPILLSQASPGAPKSEFQSEPGRHVQDRQCQVVVVLNIVQLVAKSMSASRGPVEPMFRTLRMPLSPICEPSTNNPRLGHRASVAVPEFAPICAYPSEPRYANQIKARSLDNH